ncbi:MAG: hydroxymethylglutaryl-CoA lyase [Deltaproteobacteria bacterium]|nr:hydroxymethylglutaryl-CoA lyase [Deltaproteobacteria bacterium]
MKLPDKVTVVEVGPRDGFQNEKQFIPTEKKVEIVNALARSGLKNIQVSSVVHPKAVPQLADADEVMAKIERLPGVSYRLLAPNLRGVQRALLLKPDKINLMMSVSESHNRSNANRSIEESLKEFETLVPMIKESGVAVSGGMACTFGCPFEGKIPLRQVERVADRYLSMGIRSIGIADTVGFASPKQVYGTVAQLLDKYPDVQWLAHFHNHRDLALANILAAMQAGLAEFDSAIGGLGGCPYAPNAAGNIATEDLVNMLTELDIETGVDLDALLAAAEVVRQTIPHPLNSALLKSGKPWVLAKAPDCQVKLG